MVKKATHRRTRIHNRQLVLKTIYEHGEISRAQIARVTRLTPPTVSDVVVELMQQQLVTEVGYAPSTGGKRPILLSVAADSHYLIGLDLARTDFRGALLNLRGEIKHRNTLSLDGQDGDAALSIVYALIDDLRAIADAPLLGIGIGAPGLVDTDHGIMRQSVNLNWRDVPLESQLLARYDLPVYMANDCQVAALAEYTFGEYRGSKDLVVINMSWGVGAGVILNGQVLHGNPVGAGEIGHVRAVENGERCQCGSYGCLETVASPHAIIRRAQAIAQRKHSHLNQYAATPEAITFDTILQAFQAGDDDVRQMVREVGISLGTTAAYLVAVLGICHILINGPITLFGQFFLDAMREEMSRRTLPALAQDTRIDFVSLGSDIVLKGASALLLSNELGLF